MSGSLRYAARRGLRCALASIAGPTSNLRTFGTEGTQGSSSGGKKGLLLLMGAGAAAGAYYYTQQGGLNISTKDVTAIGTKEIKPDYSAVRSAIADALEAPEGYDDGSYGPLLVRLAWHASGSYDKASNTGGSNGATMRFAPEADFGANAGLKTARDLLDPIKQKFQWISYADLWTLAGVVAVEEMGGPIVPWKPGRSDQTAGDACGPDGRLPDASKGAKHLRDIFNRMGFDDQEIVALSGAHCLGRCHPDRSGFKGPWNNAPTTFSNLYYVELMERKWTKKKWRGPLQYEDQSGELMMLPTDMTLIWDKKLKPYVQQYAKDEEKFFTDFSNAFSKLLELGVPFENPGQPAPACPAPAA